MLPYCKVDAEARCMCDDFPMSVRGLSGELSSDELVRHYSRTVVGRKSVLS